MKKGATPAQIFDIIFQLIEIGYDLNDNNFRTNVEKKYNQIYSQTSKDTIMSNLREDAMIRFQKERFIVKLPQDKNKVDLMSANINGNVVSLIVSQQKGNNSSFNSTSLSKTLEKLSEFVIKNKIKNYFNLLPDHLNPDLNGLKYEVEVIVGMFSAVGETFKIKNDITIKFLSNNNYLKYMGISDNDIVNLDYWVFNQFKTLNHDYSAIDNCCNFEDIYNKCILIIKNDGSKQNI